MNDNTARYRCFALVSGYHACSFPPRAAYDAGLRNRFAVVLSTFRPEKSEMFFDSNLFIKIADALLQVIAHDLLEIDLGGEVPVLRSLASLAERYASQEEMDREPPAWMRAYGGNRLIAIEETEWWTSVGGPAPYHDTLTFSFYTPENRSVEFRRACEIVAVESDATITAFHEALPHKEPFVPYWKRPLRWLGLA
jgi:hypothetical protein